MARKKEEVVKNFGKIKIPTKWEEISLGQFEQIIKMTGGENKGRVDVISLLSILTGQDENYINSLPASFVETLMAHLIFLNDNPRTYDHTSSQIRIGSDLYSIHFLEELKFGEYVEVNESIKNDPVDYSSILAILCRKDGEAFDEDYVANKFKMRKKMFQEQPVTEILPLIGFFLKLFLLSKANSQGCLTELESATNQLLLHIDNSVSNGTGERHSLSWRMRTTQKLKKLKNAMSLTFSSISRI